jgi:hypothetical protein
MTPCFEILPDRYKTQFFVEDIFVKIKNLNINWKPDRHDWSVVPYDYFLTDEGKKFFSDYKFVNLFHLPAGISSQVHTDNSAEAINFIVGNVGIMQWYDIGSLTTVRSIIKDGIPGPTIFSSDNLIVIAETNSSIIKVNPRIPHRIINQGTDERFCISLRKNET